MSLRSFNQVVAMLLLILISPLANAVPQLFIHAEKTESEIGRPIRLELVAVAINDKLSAIKLDELNKDFGVITDYSTADASDPRWPNQSVQILNLKIYPRKTGKLTIPALKINGAQSKILIIKSTEGKTSVPKLTLSSNEPYFRQQIIAHISVVSSSPTSRLSINKDSQAKGFESHPLAFNRTKQKDGRYRLQIGWALTALKTGSQTLQLPVIDYSVSGVTRKRFFLPTTTPLTIKPLPAYLPATIPVGKVKIKSELKQRFLLSTDSLYYWELKLNGKVNNTYRLPPVLRQIKNNDDLQFLPINSQRSINANTKTLTSNVAHSIPFKSSASGWLSLPKIRLQYFEPESGTIKTIFHQAPNILVLSPFWLTIASIIILLFLTWLFKETHKKWKRYQFTQSKYQQALTLLKEQDSNKAIREALKLIAQAEYWVENLTITQWSTLWKQKYKTDSDFEMSCHALSDVCYQSQTTHNVNNINKKLINWIINKVSI